MIIAKYILLMVFYSKSSRIFDKRTHAVHQRIIYQFHGYKSFANEGSLSGCCGHKILDICQTCQYVVNIYKYHEFSFPIKRTLGTFREPAIELYETFYMKEYSGHEPIHYFDFNQNNLNLTCSFYCINIWKFNVTNNMEKK
ncbi:hypothetical protein HZS_7940 [Henneguya salminicola]|nr:hypothetical protein HZS_7940 [Henneguya salminicola]